jgi:hypothetical protein
MNSWKSSGNVHMKQLFYSSPVITIDELYIIHIENVSRIIREIHPARIYNERHCFKDFFNVIVFFRFHIRNAT